VLRSTPAGRVYVAGNALKDGPAMQHSITVCENLGIPFGLPVYPFRLERARPAASAGLQDGYLHYDLFEPKLRQRAFKRLFDIVSSAAALWLLLPLFAVVALLVKVTSRGPVLFKQERVGLHGRRFNMLKFRSMVVNAEELKASLAKLNEQSGPVFKMRRDPRVTWIGRFIRKYSIDELPQLINVLRGDMSVVGPRPPVPSEVVKYEAWQLRRLCVRPGLTCLWQVSGRNQISFEDWMYLDMQYIDHWSLRQDLNLIFRTLPVVFLGRGAS
jgi:exopolysaccharide biosynthesis polyprenyl glycosylphosphotransferase